jgi:uncharacterized membrane protein
MDLVIDVFVFLHLIGMASLFGGLFVQVRSDRRVVSNAVLHGILTQVVTGLVLVGLHEAEAEPVPGYFHAKMGVKLVVALVILGLVLWQRRRAELAPAIYATLTGLTVLNIGVAVFWH